MNARKLPDGGVLYDETDENDDDIIEVEGDAAATPISAAIDWT